ncbi:hypothetical protein C8J56DRAFT_1054574 [Mycena floridula]|nr:hypothetical protein C8J56DRAFT_1054574 [Mycena floridula]
MSVSKSLLTLLFFTPAAINLHIGLVLNRDVYLGVPDALCHLLNLAAGILAAVTIYNRFYEDIIVESLAVTLASFGFQAQLVWPFIPSCVSIPLAIFTPTLAMTYVKIVRLLFTHRDGPTPDGDCFWYFWYISIRMWEELSRQLKARRESIGVGPLVDQNEEQIGLLSAPPPPYPDQPDQKDLVPPV